MENQSLAFTSEGIPQATAAVKTKQKCNEVVEQINKLRSRNAKKMQEIADTVMTLDLGQGSGTTWPDVHEALLKLLQCLKKASEQHVVHLCWLGGFNNTEELFGDTDIKNLDALYPIQVPEPKSREDQKHFLSGGNVH
ncbi:hypothetical protein SCLCIDRAFT_1219073 [Scleroderma citrinum Foug A]|uniref:Uncharacterized protein n=1 Tax=Scleroderma citrinum Foug A TaxID=1036808 RepID=A0A0C2Z756_9AGAM|nr:hypothetical protein SCLCIDRAFT_1219073 [Scleroderma citrinum Foug A]